MCESCKKVCHKGHDVEAVETQMFVCQCQFKMRVCELATDCTYKYTGRSYVTQTEYRCRTDNMGWGQVLCTYCAKNCHPGHDVEYYTTGGAFCDCSDLYATCKYRKYRDM